MHIRMCRPSRGGNIFLFHKPRVTLRSTRGYLAGSPPGIWLFSPDFAWEIRSFFLIPGGDNCKTIRALVVAFFVVNISFISQNAILNELNYFTCRTICLPFSGSGFQPSFFLWSHTWASARCARSNPGSFRAGPSALY